MTEQQVRAIFLLAGIEVTGAYKTENGYWPSHPNYDEMRRKEPWWLVKTAAGLVHIGWRKRVISIDWSDTTIRQEITKDDVTKSETLVHAWTYAKAVEYMSHLARLMPQPAVEQEGVAA